MPSLQDLGKLRIGEDTEEIFKSDLQLEMDAVPSLREGIAYRESVKDFVGRDLLADILESE